MLNLTLNEKIKEIASNYGNPDLAFAIETPSQKEFGDLSTNIALVLAGKLSRNPRELAEEMKPRFLELEIVENIEIKGPGFINFFFKKSYLINILAQIQEQKDNFGKTEEGKGTKIVLEHTNVNPNKALHVGHLRNACLGSSCERILEEQGYDVEAQYYVDDTGVQVAVTTLGMQNLNLSQNHDEKFDHFAQRVYVETMTCLEKDESLQEEQKIIIYDMDKQKGENAYSAKQLATKVIYSNLETMHNFQVDYDLMVWESDIINEGFWERAFTILKLNRHFKHVKEGKNIGCWSIDNPNGDEKVIVKSDGVATYTGKDIAYHMWKFNLLLKDFRYAPWPDKLQEKELYTTSLDGAEMSRFGRADKVVNFIDVRQTFPQQAVKESLRALGYESAADRLEHVGYGIVFLSPETAKELGVDISEGKDRYAMSGRKGIGILADDLLCLVKNIVMKNHPNSPAICDVAVGAIKYNMLKYNTYSDMVFDVKQATDFYGNSGPYIQYTNARCHSVLEKAGREFKLVSEYNDVNAEESDIMMWLSQFPNAVEEAAKEYSPNIMCNYLYELAKKYNTFYAKHSVLDQNNSEETVNFRLLLTNSVSIVLAKGLFLLGIPAPIKM